MDGTPKLLDDPLRPLGVTVGILLLVATFAAIASTPWQTHMTMSSAILQLIAAVGMGGIGIGLAYLSWTAKA